MNLTQLPPWRAMAALLAWPLVLAVLPWWLGLSLLLAQVAFLLVLGTRLDENYARALRRGLRFGLPGMLWALQRALGGDAVAWGAALLGALAGYMLLVGLEAWLDRDATRASSPGMTTLVLSATDEPAPRRTAASEWPEKVMGSAMGPPAEIIVLDPPQWRAGDDQLADPWGGAVVWHDGAYAFAGRRRIDGVQALACFSPDGRWFAAGLTRDRGVVLWDRRHDRLHRLRAWQLAGWHDEQPWLQRHVDAVPRPLAHVLGDGEDSPSAE